MQPYACGWPHVYAFVWWLVGVVSVVVLGVCAAAANGDAGGSERDD